MRDPGRYWPFWRLSVLKAINWQALAVESHQKRAKTIKIALKSHKHGCQNRRKSEQQLSKVEACVADAFWMAFGTPETPIWQFFRIHFRCNFLPKVEKKGSKHQYKIDTESDAENDVKMRQKWCEDEVVLAHVFYLL